MGTNVIYTELENLEKRTFEAISRSRKAAVQKYSIWGTGFASDPDNGPMLDNVGETNNADTTARDGFDENSYSDIKYYYNRNQKFPVKVFTGNIEKLEAGKYL